MYLHKVRQIRDQIRCTYIKFAQSETNSKYNLSLLSQKYENTITIRYFSACIAWINNIISWFLNFSDLFLGLENIFWRRFNVPDCRFFALSGSSKTCVRTCKASLCWAEKLEPGAQCANSWQTLPARLICESILGLVCPKP